MPNPILIELCIASVDDALAAIAGGADRLELNSALALGGLTPSAGLVAEVRERVVTPIVAMLRPRPAGFAYSGSDFQVMLRDASTMLDAGADGLAFGILTKSGKIDVPRCRQLRELCGERDAVFHRAFDLTFDPFAALETLIELGFKRVMTSGQEPTACEGMALITELIRRAAGRIEILSAGGIRPHNVVELVSRAGCDQVHASLRKAIYDSSVATRPRIRFGSLPSEGSFDHTDAEAVAQLRAQLSSISNRHC